MKLCDTKEHGEVCYEEKSCPACKAINHLKDQLHDLQERIFDLEDEISSLKLLDIKP